MRFIIAETGEEHQVSYHDKNDVDWARDVAINNGLFADGDVHEDVERDAIVAPRATVEYWENYFAMLRKLDEELDELRNSYRGEEVDDIYAHGLHQSEEIKTMAAAVKITRDTLQERYNTATAQLIGSHRSDEPADSFHYYEESLYKQNTGMYFLVGEGGTMTRYSRRCSDGSIGYGSCSIPIPQAEALAWIAKHCDGSVQP